MSRNQKTFWKRVWELLVYEALELRNSFLRNIALFSEKNPEKHGDSDKAKSFFELPRTLARGALTGAQTIINLFASLAGMEWRASLKETHFIWAATACGMAIGFAVGLMFGPLGLLLGFLVGTAVGLLAGFAIVAASKHFPIFADLIDLVSGSVEENDNEIHQNNEIRQERAASCSRSALKTLGGSQQIKDPSVELQNPIHGSVFQQNSNTTVVENPESTNTLTC